jgi:hypothetical protein
MERGPMALFGAIVAVGLGPAMWLGAQFGNAIETPNAPPAVTSEHGATQHNQDKGGAAGSAPEDPTVVVQTRPRADIKPLPDPSSSTKPSAHRSSTPPTASDDPSTASPSAEPSNTSSQPTESTSTPTDDPTDGSGDGSPGPPSPPADEDEGTGTGGIAAGTGVTLPIR